MVCKTHAKCEWLQAATRKFHESFKAFLAYLPYRTVYVSKNIPIARSENQDEETPQNQRLLKVYKVCPVVIHNEVDCLNAP